MAGRAEKLMEPLLCYECLGDIEIIDGVVSKHRNSIGGWCWMSGEAPFVWDEIATRATVPSRSNGICETCCRQPATEMHHRISRGTGGKWSPANILHLCHLCHDWITRTNNYKEAARFGLVVPSTADPEKIPVRRLTFDDNHVAVVRIGEALLLSDNLLPPRGRRKQRKGKKR
jgi:hypothetical protein